LHRPDTYVKKVRQECDLLGVPLDAAERRNLGRYVEVLIAKHGAGANELLRFCSRYAMRRAENPKIRPSQAWADVTKEAGSGISRRGKGNTNVVVGATEDLFEGEF
jgi:uncharacterized protein YciW